jgi:DNA polymerase I-like protein with 3'-5' exonuclease and polymerase domains
VTTATPSRHAEAVQFLAGRWVSEYRNKAHRALIGGLLGDRLPVPEVEALVDALCDATDDEKAADRVAMVRRTDERLKTDKPCTGWPKLAGALGPDGWQVIGRFRNLLGLVITLEDLAGHKRLPIEFLRVQGLHDLPGGGVGIPYRTLDGKEVVKRRIKLRAGDGSFWPTGQPLLAYGETRLDEAVKVGHLVLVEGETDALTLWFHGLPALGLPGAETVGKTLHFGHVSNIYVIYVVEEHGEAGRDFVANVSKRLAALGWCHQLKVVRFADAKDVSELHCKDPGAFGEALQEAIRLAGPVEEAAGASPPPPKKPVTPPDPYRPFPVGCLPEPVRSFVAQGAAALGCDVAYLALPALAAVASLIGNTRSIRLKRDWYEPCVVWSGIVGDSGTLKSPALKMVVGPLYKIQRERIDQFRADKEEYQKAKAAYDEGARQAKRDKKTLDEDPPEEPTLVRLITGDVTIEKLAELLEDNPRGLLASRDELGGWLGSFTRYKGKAGGTDLPNWLEMHRAETLFVDRKTGDRPMLFVPRAAVSVTGGIQMGALARALTAEHMEAGLAARLLLAMPAKKPKRWSEDEVDPDVRASYEDALRGLLELQFDKDDRGDKAPFVVRLTPEAKDAWVKFYREWAWRQAAVEGDLAAALSKLEAYAARLALVHHVVSHVAAKADSCDPIKPASIEAGAELARWFAYEAQRIYAALAESAEDRHTRRLIDFIRSNGGTLTARRLQRSNPARYKTADAAEAALDALVSAGLAEWVDKPAPATGRPPARELRLLPHPTPDKTDKTPDDEDAPDEGGPTQPPDTTPPGPQNPRDSGGFVSFVRCQVEKQGEPRAGKTPEAAPARNGVLSGPNRVVSGPRTVTSDPDGPNGQAPARPAGACADSAVSSAYLLVTDAAGLDVVAAALGDVDLVGLDTETTGLDPRRDRVRLLSLAVDTIDGGTFTYLIDCQKVAPRPLFDLLAEKELVGHNLAFDLGFLAALGFEPGAVHDTMLLSQLLHGPRKGKGFHGLARVAERELGRALSKDLQRSDWSGELSAEQLEYAARDAAVLLPLYARLAEQVRTAGMGRVGQVEARCLPAMVWLARSGAPFDRAAWEALAATAGREAEDLARQLDGAAPPRDGYLQKAGAWNWSSPGQVKEAFEAAGVALEKTDDDALAALDHPLAGLLREYRSASKLASTYGTTWLKGAYHDGRLHAEWRQLGCITGRMASASPNLQNLPGDPRYRHCFRAPEGRVLVKADYSQIELRIAAKVTGDKAMLDAYARGEDLHTLTARRMLGKAEVSAAERKLAKPVNFGLIYGLGVKALRLKAKAEYGLDLSPEEAERYRRAFFAGYPGVAAWHRRLRGETAPEVRTLAGRRCPLPEKHFYGTRANYTVQGTGGDGIKLALALLWERRDQAPGAFPVPAVHDEIVVEADAGRADAVATWLKAAMVEAMAPLIDPVPVEVEVKVGATWGGD